MTLQKHTCPECGKRMRQSAGLLCDKCVRDESTRKRYGVLTAADFSLHMLDVRERMLLFLYAAGQDISGYLREPDHTPRGDHPDLDALGQKFGFHHKRLTRKWLSTLSISDMETTQPSQAEKPQPTVTSSYTMPEEAP